MSGPDIGPEFRLLAQCCRWNFLGAEPQPPPPLPASLDWNHFLNLARRHRVQGLVWNALAKHSNRIAEAITGALSADARKIAATNLAIAAECGALQDAFDGANLPVLFIKGLSVGALAYRSPLLKMGWDIDLLIDPGDLPKAARLLTERGYLVRIPDQIARLQSWHGWSKESVWHRDGVFHVELHTRLADNLRLIPTIDVYSPRQEVEVSPGVTLTTLAEDELFAYLAVHGASSAWFRLKWISDFAAMIQARGHDDLERLYRRSQELGACRASGQALLLADRLFDVLEPVPALRERLAGDRAIGMLSSAALRLMTGGANEPTERPLGTLAIHWTQFLLNPSLSFKIAELRRQGTGLFRG